MHSGTVEFRQKITVSKLPVTVSGFVTFMSCDDTQCLPARCRVLGQYRGEVAASAASAEQAAGTTVPADKPRKGFLKFFLLSMLAGFAGYSPVRIPDDTHDSGILLTGNRIKGFRYREGAHIRTLHNTSLLVSGHNSITHQRRRRVCKYSQHTLDPQSSFLYTLPGICRFVLWRIRDCSSLKMGQHI